MNAKEEFLRHTSSKSIKCALIKIGYYEVEMNKIILKIGYSLEDYENFLKHLDFDYDDGYGGQELYGDIWYIDNTWSSRGEYDGSEWWDHHTIPEIPTELLSS